MSLLWDDTPPWIPGTPYRADCAVGQLRPVGMRPCAGGPSMTWRNVGTARIQMLNGDPRYLDRENLCETHSLPTGAECERRMAELDAKAELQLATSLNPKESEWNRGEARKAAHWLRTQANLYRRWLYQGRTAEWTFLNIGDVVMPDEWEYLDTRGNSVEPEPIATAAD